MLPLRAHCSMLRLSDQRHRSLDLHGINGHLFRQIVAPTWSPVSRTNLWQDCGRCKLTIYYFSWLLTFLTWGYYNCFIKFYFINCIRFVLGNSYFGHQSVKALNYLKDEHSVIHRDVKPSNILINHKGIVKLCDFGISGRLVNSKAKTRQAGCAAYMAVRISVLISSWITFFFSVNQYPNFII